MIRELRDHFFAGVTAAELGFPYAQEDEDSLTGAVGQSLLAPRTEVRTEGGAFVWETHSYKVRGRGKGAPEKSLGVDGVFELEVHDHVRDLTRHKGLLFQAKKNWRGADHDLLDQVQSMSRIERDSIVIDYRRDGYRAFDALDVLEARGNRRGLRAGQALRLAEVLGEQFLKCRRGVVGMRYDENVRKLIIPASNLREGLTAAMADHVIVTSVDRLA
jgi:hypothetical protein